MNVRRLIYGVLSATGVAATLWIATHHDATDSPKAKLAGPIAAIFFGVFAWKPHLNSWYVNPEEKHILWIALAVAIAVGVAFLKLTS